MPPIPDTTQVSANQAYKEAQKKGDKRSFAEWLSNAKDKGYFTKGNELLSILLKDKAVMPVGDAPSPSPSKGGTKILGMPKPVAIGVGIALAALVGYGIYALVKAKKK